MSYTERFWRARQVQSRSETGRNYTRLADVRDALEGHGGREPVNVALSAWERSFLSGLFALAKACGYEVVLSPKQEAVLERVEQRIAIARRAVESTRR